MSVVVVYGPGEWLAFKTEERQRLSANGATNPVGRKQRKNRSRGWEGKLRRTQENLSNERLQKLEKKTREAGREVSTVTRSAEFVIVF